RQELRMKPAPPGPDDWNRWTCSVADHCRHDPGERSWIRQFLLATGACRRVDDGAPVRLVRGQDMGGDERVDAYGPDLPFLSFYCRRFHDLVFRRPARTRRFAAGADEACGTAERADPADRLRHSDSALREFFNHALPGSAATDRCCVSVCSGDYVVDRDARTRNVDCRAAGRLLRGNAVRARNGMRSCGLDDAALQPGRMA